MSKPILLADNTSIIITNSDISEFKKNINNVFIKINSWLKSNLLSLNFDKTHYLHFITKNSQEIDMQILYKNKHISNTYNTKFLRLIIDSSMSRQVRIEELYPKLNKACYGIRLIKLFVSLEVLRLIYFLMFTVLYHMA
jgi:hypothetical protein